MALTGCVCCLLGLTDDELGFLYDTADLMMQCPDLVDDKQLDELSIAVTRVEKDNA